jgi:hypothetical protein
MTPPIPDQLRQWYAQFIAGDVLFSRIMADIDAAIACYVDPLTPEKVIELAQLHMLKVMLIGVVELLDVPDVALLAGLGYVAQAMELTERWNTHEHVYSAMLSAIYAVLPYENPPLLHKLSDLMDQNYVTWDKVVAVLLKRGHFELAWQWTRLPVSYGSASTPSEFIHAYVQVGDFRAAFAYWNALPDISFFSLWIGEELALALFSGGLPSEARQCLAQLEVMLAQIEPRHPKQVWSVVRPYLRIHDDSAALRLLNTYVWAENERSLIDVNGLLPELRDSLADASYWTSERLQAFHAALHERYHVSIFGLAIAQRLLALGDHAAALPIFRQQIQQPELLQIALPALQQMGDTATITSVLADFQAQIDAAKSPEDQRDAELNMLGIRFLLRQDNEVEHDFAKMLPSLEELWDWREGSVEHLTLIQDWAALSADVNRWAALPHTLDECEMAFDLLCRAANFILPHDRQQALHWIDYVLALPFDDDEAGNISERELCDLLFLAGRIDDLERLLARPRVYVDTIYEFATELLNQNQPEASYRFFRLARIGFVAQSLRYPQFRLADVNLSTSHSLVTTSSYGLARWWQQHIIDLDSFKQVLSETAGLVRAIAPDLPERTLDACMALLNEFTWEEQPA